MKRVAGTLRLAPAAQKRNDLMTINDYKTRLGQETARRGETERQQGEQVSAAMRRARFAERHQATAEGVSAHVAAERDRAAAATEKAQKDAAAATVAAATAGMREVAALSATEVEMFETEVARKSEAVAHAAAELATEQQEAAIAASALLSSRLQETAKGRAEAQAMADASAHALTMAKAEAEVAARAERERSRAEHEASELQHSSVQKAAARQLAAVVERLSSSELRACSLQAELTSTLCKVCAQPQP